MFPICNGVNFNQLKKLVKRLGGILVLNGNEPEFVILPYSQYEKESGVSDSPREDVKKRDEDEERTIEKLNREILALKEEIRQKESAELVENIESAREEEQTAEVIDFE